MEVTNTSNQFRQHKNCFVHCVRHNNSDMETKCVVEQWRPETLLRTGRIWRCIYCLLQPVWSILGSFRVARINFVL
jgi:hypothetical protein